MQYQTGFLGSGKTSTKTCKIQTVAGSRIKITTPVSLSPVSFKASGLKPNAEVDCASGKYPKLRHIFRNSRIIQKNIHNFLPKPAECNTTRDSIKNQQNNTSLLRKRMFSGKADKPDKNCPIIAN